MNSIVLNKSEQLAIDRELCRQSLPYFISQAWHVLHPSTPLMWNWAPDAICQHLQAAADGEIRFLLITVPPGSMKSLLTTTFLPAWIWGPRYEASKSFLTSSYDVDLAVDFSRKTKTLIESDWYQERWPIQWMPDSKGVKKHTNTEMGYRTANSFYSLTGKRADFNIADDPINNKKAQSAAELKNARIEWNETFHSRVNNPNTAVCILIMQRLHVNDPAGLAIESGKYTHLMIPMEYEPDRKCVTPIWSDPRKEAGELMFPQLFSREKVNEMKKELGTYGTSGQYQQRPVPRGGAIIKEAWWSWWYEEAPPRILYRKIFVDTAMEEQQENDYSVFQCFGMTDRGQIALLDQIRGKWEGPELNRRARQFWQKHRAIKNQGMLSEMRVEKKVSGTTLIQTLKRSHVTPEGIIMPPIPVKGIPRSIDKVTRCYAASPQIEGGNVLLPHDATWIDDYIQEFCDFPNGSHDDQVDPTLDAIDVMLGKDVNGPAPLGKPKNMLGPRTIKREDRV